MLRGGAGPCPPPRPAPSLRGGDTRPGSQIQRSPCFALSAGGRGGGWLVPPGAQVLRLRRGPAPRAANARWRATAGPALLPGGSGVRGAGVPGPLLAAQPRPLRRTVGRTGCSKAWRPGAALPALSPAPREAGARAQGRGSSPAARLQAPRAPPARRSLTGLSTLKQTNKKNTGNVPKNAFSALMGWERPRRLRAVPTPKGPRWFRVTFL